MGCELRAGQGSLQCTESRTTRSGPWAALDPQRPSAATAFTNLCAPGKPPSREMGASLHFWPGHLRGPPRSLPSLTLLAGVGGRGATSQLPPPQNKLTSPAGSLLMGPHSGGRKMDGHCPQSLECLPLPAQVLGPPWSPGLTQTVMLPFGRNVCCLHVKRHFNAQENVVGRRALRDRDSLSLKKKNHLDVLIVTLHTLSARRRVDWGDWVLLTKPIYVSLSEFTT